LKRVEGELQRLFGKSIIATTTPRLALEQWVQVLASESLPHTKGRILITALRNPTWIEWAIYCAAVVRRMGYSSTILFRKSEVDKFYTEPNYFDFWKGVRKIPDIALLNVEELPYDEKQYEQYYAENEKRAIAALAYDYHIEAEDIDTDLKKYGEEIEYLRHEAAENGARLHKHFSKNLYHQFICYSGIIRDTFMLLQAAKEANQEVVCVEGWAWRKGHMIYNFGEPALEYNVEGWMRHFGEWNEEKNTQITNYFKFLDEGTKDEDWLNNFYRVQKGNLSKELPAKVQDFVKGKEKVILLACNVIGDSSLLNRETIFSSHKAFVRATIEYFATTRTDAKLIVRAHPAEEWVTSKVKIKMGEYAADIAKDIPNVLVLDSKEELNTFSLVPFVHGGLVWLSSAGVDLVVRGVTAIAAAQPKYYGLGIVQEPKNQEEYFQMLDLLIDNGQRPNVTQIQKAKEYLYLVFKGFSFEAQGENYRAVSCRLGDMPNQEEHDRFYKILLKEAPAPDLQ